MYITQTSKISIQQLSASPPTGFVNYLGATVIATATLGANDYFSIRQYIEGFNTSDFAWGTANAKSATLSFWVYSNLTGTFGGSLSNNGSTCYPFSYSIPTANTWTQISITVTGPTSGTFNTNNTCGILLCLSAGTGTTYSGTAGAWGSTFYMSATGATSIMGTVSNYLYITGVQLEVGSQATSFDYRDYGRELMLCQRYYETFGRGIGVGTTGTTACIGAINYKVAKRASPTLATPSVVGVHEPSSGVFTQSSVSISAQYTDNMSGQLLLGNFSGMTAYRPAVVFTPTDGKAITADCEL
jgi:hypothetical protein